ncbi:MAG: DUF1127 domain-containing protein [Pseudomonadota bacterium]
MRPSTQKRPRPLRPIPSWAKLIRRWRSVSRQRRHLSQFTDRELDDIGLTRAQTDPNTARAFWDARSIM